MIAPAQQVPRILFMDDDQPIPDARPVAFGRAVRIKNQVLRLATRPQLRERWAGMVKEPVRVIIRAVKESL